MIQREPSIRRTFKALLNDKVIRAEFKCKDPGRVEDPASRGGPGFGLPLEGGCLYRYLFVGVLECWSSGPPWCDMQGHTLGSVIY